MRKAGLCLCAVAIAILVFIDTVVANRAEHLVSSWMVGIAGAGLHSADASYTHVRGRALELAA